MGVAPTLRGAGCKCPTAACDEEEVGRANSIFSFCILILTEDANVVDESSSEVMDLALELTLTPMESLSSFFGGMASSLVHDDPAKSAARRSSLKRNQVARALDGPEDVLEVGKVCQGVSVEARPPDVHVGCVFGSSEMDAADSRIYLSRKRSELK